MYTITASSHYMIPYIIMEGIDQDTEVSIIEYLTHVTVSHCLLLCITAAGTSQHMLLVVTHHTCR